MPRRTALHLAGADLPRPGGPLSRFLARGALGPGSRLAATARLFASAGLFVHRLPGPFFGEVLRRSARLVAFLDMPGLAFLFVRIFGFGSSRHKTRAAQCVPTGTNFGFPIVAKARRDEAAEFPHAIGNHRCLFTAQNARESAPITWKHLHRPPAIAAT